MTEIDIDEDALAEAMLFFNTNSIDEAVNRALRWVIEDRRLARARSSEQARDLD